MFVTLLETVASLGPKGLTIEVPDGYAKNFLFPQFLAVQTSESNAEAPAKMPSKAEQEEQSLASAADGLELTISVPVKDGKLKKPVTATEIRAALKEQDVAVPKNVIKTDPLTEPGTFEVDLEFPSGFDAKVRVNIESASG